jgi:phosphatidylserine/phosphatidylglycerophosphate/cardiolipin synthase-like enzyme
MIYKIKYWSLRKAEYIQYMKAVHQLVSESAIDTIQNLGSQLKAKADILESQLTANKASPFTEMIYLADEKRDSCYRGLIRIVDGNTFHWNALKAQAAKSIYKVMQSQGSRILDLNLQAESTVLSSLISQLETKTELMEAVATLDLEDWVEQLKIMNNKCISLLVERTQEKANLPNTNASEQKNNCTEVYLELIRNIESHITLNSEGNYTKLKEDINQLVMEYNHKLKLRE